MSSSDDAHGAVDPSVDPAVDPAVEPPVDHAADSPSEHPDTDTLADHAAEVLDEPAATTVRTHVQACPACQERLASHADIQRLLGELPSVSMPADVAARIETSLRTQVTPTATPLARRSRWRRFSSGRPGAGLAGLAAAAAVALLVSGVIAGALHVRNGDSGSGGHSSTAAGTNSALAAPPRTYVTTYSGADYTKASLATAVPHLIGSPATGPAHSTAGSGGTAGTAGAAQAAPVPTPTGKTLSLDSAAPATTGSLSTLDRLAKQPAALFACIAALTGTPRSTVVPLAVDIARYNGQPAAVIVLPSPGHPADVEAWVVGPGCGQTPGGDVKLFERVPRG